MLYLVIILTALLIGLLLIRIRLRLILDRDQKALFLGLGRSGPEIDFIEKVGRIRLFGLRVATFGRKQSEKKEQNKKSKTPKRRLQWSDIVPILPQIGRVFRSYTTKVGRTLVTETLAGKKAYRSYAIELVRSVTIEELAGKIEAGFESPDYTGQAYGYYHAALATVPGLAGRFSYIPDWSGASFGGSLRFSAALPLHKIITRTIVLLWRLPLKDMIKLAIGSRKGASDG